MWRGVAWEFMDRGALLLARLHVRVVYKRVGRPLRERVGGSNWDRGLGSEGMDTVDTMPHGWVSLWGKVDSTYARGAFGDGSIVSDEEGAIRGKQSSGLVGVLVKER